MPVRIKLVRRLPPARSPQSLSSSPASSSQQTSSSNEAGDLVEANEGADEESGSSGGTSNSDETSVRSVAGADFQGIPIETALAELQQRLEVLEQRNLQRNLLGLPTLDSDSDSESLPTTDKMQIERRLKIVTEQHNIPKESPMAEFPMKEWSVELYLLDADGKERPADCFTKVTYNLHPSFENPNQTFHEAPFTCKNEGWGEFEMSIDMFTTEKGGKITVYHDLNFAAPKYDNVHTISFKNPSQALISLLRATGPVSNDDDPRSSKARKTNDGKKRKAGWDFEKMADALGKLNEDDLLYVIQLIHDNKSDDTFIKNDIDAGEFSVDLFTLPDALCKLVWDFLADQKLL